MSSKIVLIVLVLHLLMLLLNCEDINNLNDSVNTELNITVEDTNATQVYFRLKIISPSPSNPVILMRDSIQIFNSIILASDTTIVDDELLPKHTYMYTVYLKDGKSKNTIRVSTLDTTSHDIAWSLASLGDGGGSYYNDVAIVNDSLIFVVGEIYKRDSTGKIDENIYNLAQWDGKQWQLKRLVTNARILYPGSGGDSTITISGTAIIAFSPSDIWVCAGNVFHFNGTSWSQQRAELAGFSNRIWGKNSDNLYFVGNSGMIVYHNNSKWNRLTAQTDLNYYDIWGDDTGDDNTEVLVVGSKVGTKSGNTLISIKSNSIFSQNLLGIQGNLTSLWFIKDRSYFTASSNLFSKHRLNDTAWKENKPTQYSLTSISGTSVNDVFVSCTYGDILHFNGVTWRSYYDQTKLFQGLFIKIVAKANTIVSVGYQGNNDVIAIGRR